MNTDSIVEEALTVCEKIVAMDQKVGAELRRTLLDSCQTFDDWFRAAKVFPKGSSRQIFVRSAADAAETAEELEMIVYLFSESDTARKFVLGRLCLQLEKPEEFVRVLTKLGIAVLPE